MLHGNVAAVGVAVVITSHVTVSEESGWDTVLSTINSSSTVYTVLVLCIRVDLHVHHTRSST